MPTLNPTKAKERFKKRKAEERAAIAWHEAIVKEAKLRRAMANRDALEALGAIRENRENLAVPSVLLWARQLVAAEEAEREARAEFLAATQS
jgi:hypothetical protein